MSAVEAAQRAISSAVTEAKCNLPNGVGVVKLMGRSAGYIAAYATLASGDIDLCLVPEAPIVLDGPAGCLPHIEKRVRDKGYAVVVVAEGAGEELLGESTERDASGNKRLPPIGEFMKMAIESYFKRHGKTATVKYIDPSYMIRSVSANAFDQIYCMQIAGNAVHGAMAGLTAFSAGVVNNRTVYIPMTELVENSPRNMNVRGRTWERVLSLTLQPNTVDVHRSFPEVVVAAMQAKANEEEARRAAAAAESEEAMAETARTKGAAAGVAGTGGNGMAVVPPATTGAPGRAADGADDVATIEEIEDEVM
ncbi:unnamed protein product [Phaeothamnion confervicola]